MTLKEIMKKSVRRINQRDNSNSWRVLIRKKHREQKNLENSGNGGSLVQNYKLQCQMFLIINKMIITFIFKHCDISENVGLITEL
jgi:hypothetical protein